MRNRRHAYERGALGWHGCWRNTQPDTRLEMDPDRLLGIADVVDGLQVRNAVQEHVTLHHSAIGDRPERWRERQGLLGQIQLEDIVVRPVSRVGQWCRRDSEVLWPED